jgi:hypothetical protein
VKSFWIRSIFVCSLFVGLIVLFPAKQRASNIDDPSAEAALNNPIAAMEQKLRIDDAGPVDQSGASVAVSGDTLVVGSPGDRVRLREPEQGSVSVFVRNNSGGGWTSHQKITVGDGVVNDRFGSAVSISGDTLAVGAPQSNASQGSVYIFTRSNTVWALSAKIMPLDGVAGDLFGCSVAIDGDRLIVGARMARVGQNEKQGAAYIFHNSNGEWIQQRRLSGSNGAAEDQFGSSVALFGDFALVGAPEADIGVNRNQGAAFVFGRSRGRWAEQFRLTSSDGAAADNFGSAVALTTDMAVVGATMNDFGLTSLDQGSAYLFARAGSTWVQKQQLWAADGAEFDQFGRSLAISGDALIVGASGDDLAGYADHGSAYLFTQGSEGWTQQRRLFAPDGAAGDQFGAAVAIHGDTVLAGAPSKHSVFPAEGATYVYTLRDTNLVQQPPIIPAEGKFYSNYGTAVALSGDTLVVGATGDGDRGRGAAYVYIRADSGWTLQQKILAEDGAAEDFFGESVAISGNLLVVGAYGDDLGQHRDRGSVYVYVRNVGQWSLQAKLVSADGAPGDGFGRSVAVSGRTIAVGAFKDDIGGHEDQGSAYVFFYNGSIWTEQQKLIAAEGIYYDYFGASVAISGDTVIAGAQGDTFTNIRPGAAYVFTREGFVWTQQQRLVAEDGENLDKFGRSVALSGDTAIVGSFHDTVGDAKQQGSAYVFVRSRKAWSLQQKLTALDGAAGANFGTSVAVEADALVVGAAADSAKYPLQGATYLFLRNGLTWKEAKKLTAADAAVSDRLGVAVAVSGGFFAAGAYTKITPTNNGQGAVYVYEAPAEEKLSLKQPRTRRVD